MMYEDIVRHLRDQAEAERGFYDGDEILYIQAADAIEELSRQLDRSYVRLCEWCGLCPWDKRNAEDCEIAALNPGQPEEES